MLVIVNTYHCQPTLTPFVVSVLVFLCFGSIAWQNFVSSRFRRRELATNTFDILRYAVYPPEFAPLTLVVRVKLLIRGLQTVRNLRLLDVDDFDGSVAESGGILSTEDEVVATTRSELCAAAKAALCYLQAERETAHLRALARAWAVHMLSEYADPERMPERGEQTRTALVNAHSLLSWMHTDSGADWWDATNEIAAGLQISFPTMDIVDPVSETQASDAYATSAPQWASAWTAACNGAGATAAPDMHESDAPVDGNSQGAAVLRSAGERHSMQPRSLLAIGAFELVVDAAVPETQPGTPVPQTEAEEGLVQPHVACGFTRAAALLLERMMHRRVLSRINGAQAAGVMPAAGSNYVLDLAIGRSHASGGVLPPELLWPAPGLDAEQTASEAKAAVQAALTRRGQQQHAAQNVPTARDSVDVLDNEAVVRLDATAL